MILETMIACDQLHQVQEMLYASAADQGQGMEASDRWILQNQQHLHQYTLFHLLNWGILHLNKNLKLG